MDNILYIVRGLPGSGKSTYAKSIGCLHLEADMYFNRSGEYTFKPELIKKAHSWCQEATDKALNHGMDVVVSNTFTKLWEMEPYLKMHNNVLVYKCTGDYGSLHDVPFSVIHDMSNRWEDFEGEIVV
ncbi:MAG: AAA family ATPase [Blastopirellula sp.]|nr:MAG: AAA family ATPase [Blastopirellula sp.]